jgi:magnesium transporter
VVGDNWTHLVDPTREVLDKALPTEVHDQASEQLLAPSKHDDEPRPRIESHGNYVFGVFLVAIAVREEDAVFYQEVDFVLTRDKLVTVHKTPPGRTAYDPSSAMAACRQHDDLGMVLYHLVDDIAERFLDLVDDINDEIDELEEQVEDLPAETVRGRISTLRHDLLHIRRVLAPTRDAVREIVDNRVDLDGEEIFPHEVELYFGSVYDKLMRATDGLDLSRDLVAGVRDYHQAKIANDQNDVMKRLTVVASLILLPTFIVGLYGQNFVHMPELHWRWGYAYSWALIIVTTIAQLIWFRRKRWI